LNLGHYEDPQTAAQVVDFARYLCFGLNPANWHPNVGRPNHPPCIRADFSRVFVLSRLLRLGAAQRDVLQTRLVEHGVVGLKERRVQYVLADLLHRGLVERIGKRGGWKLTAEGERFISPTPQPENAPAAGIAQEATRSARQRDS
jgi:predicted transcriptional regulator